LCVDREDHKTLFDAFRSAAFCRYIRSPFDASARSNGMLLGRARTSQERVATIAAQMPDAF